MSRRIFVAAAAASLLTPGLIGFALAVDGTGGPTAASPQPVGKFTCRASAVRLTGAGLLADLPVFEPFAANRDGTVCATDGQGILNPAFELPEGLGSVRVLYASTDADQHEAEAGVAQVVLTLPDAPEIRVNVLTSEARTVCNNGQPAFQSDSDVVRLQIGEEVVEVPEGPEELVVAENLALYLNEEVTGPTGDGGTQRVQRALRLETPLGQVVIAESIADYHGNPCGAPPTTQPPTTPPPTTPPPTTPPPTTPPPTTPPPTTPPPTAQPHVPGGFMTGGGRFGSSPTETTGSTSHGMVIPCTIGANPGPNLTVNWDTGSFKLDRITAIRCTDEPGYGPENPQAGFDTVEGTGTGTCRNKRGGGSGTSQIRFRFTDQGEPGRNRDTGSVSISGFCTWNAAGTLTPGGNHQAHDRNAPKPTSASPQPSATPKGKGGKG